MKKTIDILLGKNEYFVQGNNHCLLFILHNKGLKTDFQCKTKEGIVIVNLRRNLYWVGQAVLFIILIYN